MEKEGETMNPEPLTKEEREKLQRSLELMAVIEEEVGEARKELNNIWFNLPRKPTEKDWKKFREEVKQILSPLFELLQLHGYSFELKERVNWLLKEIEKNKKYSLRKWDKTEDSYYHGTLDGLQLCENLIKKAFSGVIEK